MKLSRIMSTCLVAGVAAIGGCAPLDEELLVNEDIQLGLEPAAVCTYCYEPPSGKNGLLPEQFWSATTQRSMRELQNFALDSGSNVILSSGEIVPVMKAPPFTATLLQTYPSVVRHLIQCTLGPTQAVYDSYNETVYRGWWGLTKSWMNTPISGAPILQEWATACMIARLNAEGVHVNILLEGARTPIEVNPPLNSFYPWNESTVQGNMFASTLPITGTSPAFHAYICREAALANYCPDEGEEWIDYRICDDYPSICGLIDLGRCGKPVGLGGNCQPNGEHWECKEGSGAITFNVETIGVQLEAPIPPSKCDPR